MRAKLKMAILAVVVVPVVLVLLHFIMQRYHQLTHTPPGQSAEDQLGFIRVKFMTPARVVELLNPQPASTILDLGAGYGLFTFPLAQAVGENGTVFATDIDPKALAFLTEQILKKNLKNIVPVQVKADGLDNFYTQHTFDTILISDVVPLISELEVFFGQLRASLREGSGRLWVVDLRMDPDFTVLEFDDWISTDRDSVRVESLPSIFNRLSEKTRQEFETLSGVSVPESLRALVVEDLNRMLEDRTLWPEMRAGNLPLNHRERRLRKYLLYIIHREGTFGENAEATITPRARRAIRLLNRLIIQELLNNYQWEKAFGLETLTWSQRVSLLTQIDQGHDYPSLFSKVGYELVQEHATLPYHRVWEFKRAH